LAGASFFSRIRASHGHGEYSGNGWPQGSRHALTAAIAGERYLLREAEGLGELGRGESVGFAQCGDTSHDSFEDLLMILTQWDIRTEVGLGPEVHTLILTTRNAGDCTLK
jgi:hypothetical protein